jgi:ribosomal protein L32
MKRLSWKYMAGIIDGEGCIDMQITKQSLSQNLTIRPRLRMTLAGDEMKPLLDMCATNFGGNVNCKPHKEDTPSTWKTPYVWCLTGKTPLRSFLQNVANHMWIKKEQAKFAIWWIDNMSGKQLLDEIKECAKAEMKAMKTDPQRLSERAVRNIQELCETYQIQKPWASHFKQCIQCGGSEIPHHANGKCKKCYRRIDERIDAIVQPIESIGLDNPNLSDRQADMEHQDGD